MTMTAISDMAQQFSALRAGGAIKSDLARLSASLSSGRVEDVTRHLNGETAQLSGIQHKLTQLDGYQQVARETGQMLDRIQQVLAQVDTMRTELTNQLLLVGDSSTNVQVDAAAQTARSALDAMVSAMNTRMADRVLFGGRDSATPPLITADAIITAVQAAIGPDRSLAGITAAISGWFDDPGGGFEVFGYRGDTEGTMQRQISEDRQIQVSVRADDPAIRDILKATVLAAITDDLPGLPADVKTDLVQSAGTRLSGTASGMVAVQARIGLALGVTAAKQAEMTGQQTGLNMAMNDLIMADPFDTATRIKAVELQLETHYTIIGRLSQLSLLKFI